MMEEGGAAAMARMEGRASIDGEPKTLSFHQIKLAREAALYVVNTCTVEEALRIFTEGKPKRQIIMKLEESMIAFLSYIFNSRPPLICTFEGLEPVICRGNRLDLEEEPNDDDVNELQLPSRRDAVSAPF